MDWIAMFPDRPAWAGRRLMKGAVATAMVVATLASPVRGSRAQGIAIPPNAPSLQSFQAAAIGTNNEAYADYFKLVRMTDPAGNLLTVETSNGLNAIAYLDPVGNVIVAYAWDATPIQDQLSSAVISGYDPSSVPGYADALTFLHKVEAAAAAEGIPSSKLYLTGFSLGAMMASYVGSQSGLPGVSFASCGIPGYQAPASPANNFISFVEASDPVAQYGTDTLERRSAVAANPHMDHYGFVFVLGTPNAQVLDFNSKIAGYTLPEYEAGKLPISQDQIDALDGEYNDLDTANHQMSLYNPDTYALASSYGIDPTAS